MPCIESIIANHREMFFRDMLDEEGNEIQYRNCFSHVGINAGSGNYRSSKEVADVFYDNIRVAEIEFLIDTETVLIFWVNVRLSLFERRTNIDRGSQGKNMNKTE